MARDMVNGGSELDAMEEAASPRGPPLRVVLNGLLGALRDDDGMVVVSAQQACDFACIKSA